jgi:hypothetical protein
MIAMAVAGLGGGGSSSGGGKDPGAGKNQNLLHESDNGRDRLNDP